MIRAEHSKSV